MKVSTVLAAPLLVQGALAFVPSTHQPKISMALQAEKKQSNNIVAAASACLLGLGLSVQVADASFLLDQQQAQYLSPAVSSSTVVAEIEQFALPSYDASTSKGSKLIDLNDELSTVNKKDNVNYQGEA